MKQTLGLFAAVAFFLLMICGAIWWQFYKWQDCRHVGHSWLYCAMTTGR